MGFLSLRSRRFNNVLNDTQYLPVLTTNAASSVTTTSALANGSLDDAGAFSVTEQGFVYSTSASPTTADSKVTVTAPTYGSYSQTISGLTPGVTYYYRAYAINSYGTAYGADQSFATSGGAVSAFSPTLSMMGVG